MNSIVYQPRTGEEVRKAISSHPPIYLYSKLAQLMREHGAEKVLLDMFKRNHDAVILVQDPRNMRSGHWTALSFHPETKEVFFFSSYGGKPDVEKNEWIPHNQLMSSGQDLNVFNDGLKTYAKKGWKVHYSQYPYQVVGDKTATCGIWCAAFLNSRMNPDDFHNVVQQLNLTPEKLYYLFFR